MPVIHGAPNRVIAGVAKCENILRDAQPLADWLRQNEPRLKIPPEDWPLPPRPPQRRFIYMACGGPFAAGQVVTDEQLECHGPTVREWLARRYVLEIPPGMDRNPSYLFFDGPYFNEGSFAEYRTYALPPTDGERRSAGRNAFVTEWQRQWRAFQRSVGTVLIPAVQQLAFDAGGLRAPVDVGPLETFVVAPGPNTERLRESLTRLKEAAEQEKREPPPPEPETDAPIGGAAPTWSCVGGDVASLLQATLVEHPGAAAGEAAGAEEKIRQCDFARISGYPEGTISRAARKPGFALTRRNAEEWKKNREGKRPARATPGKAKPKRYMCQGCGGFVSSRDGEQPKCTKCVSSPGYDPL